MQKKFISNLALMVLLNLLVKPIAIFGIDAEVQNRVGDVEYGIYFSLLNFSFLFNILLDLGINNFTTKNVAQHPNVASSYLNKVLTFRFILFGLYAVVSFAIGYLLNWDSRAMYMLSFLILNQFIITLIAYTRSHFGGLLMFKTDAVISVLDRFLLIIFCGILIYTPVTSAPFKIEWFIWIQTVCYGITLVVAAIMLISKFGVPKLKFDPTFSYSIIKKSFPYALLIFLMMIYTRIDSVMVERMHFNGKAEAGYYAKGFRLLNAFFMFAMIFSSLLFPIFSKMFKQKENVTPLLSTAAKLLIGGAILIGIISFFNGEYILSLIYDHDIEKSTLPFQLLMFSFVGMCSTIMFGTLLTAKGDMKFLNTISAIGIVINITINSFLIPKYGATGAAVATVITQSLISLIQFIYSVYVLKIKFTLLAVGRFSIFVSSLFTLCFYVKADSGLALFGLCSAGVIGMMLFRLIDLKNLSLILKLKE
ncbi:MAG: O-antigen/teichoic acid export membrane protein [Salibacteraceae bacterium]|jgi:O-antigen/teichoic acid export membrane protein